jgi:3-dehydroquinate dehydratase/shikimate dehydrogenase
VFPNCSTDQIVRRTTLVATLTTPPSADGHELEALADHATVLEVRADLITGLDPDWLRQHFPGELLYTLRSRAEGGAFEGGKAARRKRIEAAAPHYDLVDLEAERDLAPDLLAQIGKEKRLLSWHGTANNLTSLRGRFERLTTTPARYYKLIPHAHKEGDALRPLALLHALGRDDVICFSTGDPGTWTRLVAPRLGSPLTYGAFGEQIGAPGQLTLERLVKDFGLPDLPDVEALYGIVGQPVMHSLSPRLHNGAYRALGIPALYLPFAAPSFGDFWLDVVEMTDLERYGLPLAGLSVTSPHKAAALAVAGATSPRADYIGAANTLVKNDEVWEAESTDPEGVTGALQAHGVAMAGVRAVVVGCGGAGKAAALGLHLAGAEVILVNRGRKRGEQAARELRLPFCPLSEFDPAHVNIVVHATALGHHEEDPLPFPTERLQAEATLVEMVYGDGSTRLEHAASKGGSTVIGGREVLLHQALEQFRLMTGHKLERELAAELLGLALRSPLPHG